MNAELKVSVKTDFQECFSSIYFRNSFKSPRLRRNDGGKFTEIINSLFLNGVSIWSSTFSELVLHETIFLKSGFCLPLWDNISGLRQEKGHFLFFGYAYATIWRKAGCIGFRGLMNEWRSLPTPGLWTTWKIHIGAW